MLGKICIQAFVIGVLSTGIYMAFTKSENRDPYSQKSRTNECLCIAGIVFGVSVLLLLMTNKSDTLSVRETSGSRTLNHKPPF